MGQVGHYIHLNPVRAGVVPADRLAEYRYSSYWYLAQPKLRPVALQFTAVLLDAGSLGDEAAGWDRYQAYLAWQAAEGPLGKSRAYVSLSKGWALGSAAFKATLIRDHAVAARSRAWESQGAREIREHAWAHLFTRALRVLGREESELKVGGNPPIGKWPWRCFSRSGRKPRIPGWPSVCRSTGPFTSVGSFRERVNSRRRLS